MEDDPFDAVASAIRVVMIRALDWDANIASMAAHAAEAVTSVEIWPRISFDRDASR